MSPASSEERLRNLYEEVSATVDDGLLADNTTGRNALYKLHVSLGKIVNALDKDKEKTPVPSSRRSVSAAPSTASAVTAASAATTGTTNTAVTAEEGETDAEAEADDNTVVLHKPITEVDEGEDDATVVHNAPTDGEDGDEAMSTDGGEE